MVAMDRNVYSPLMLLATLLIAGCGSDDEPTTTPDGGTDTVSESDGSSAVDTGGTDTVGPGDTADDGVTPDDVGGEDASIEWPECDSTSVSGLAGCVEIERYATDLEAFAVTRPTGTAALATLREELVQRLTDLGYDVELDDSIGQGTNIIGRIDGSTAADEVVVLSAHYDSVPLCAGADDNATGVAGALEAARVLALTEHERTLVVAFWDEEERGKTGSWNWADAAAADDMKIVVSLVFEMIGFTTDEPDSQRLPAGFNFVFPDVADALDENDNRGDFIGLISNESAQPFADIMMATGETLGLPSISVPLSEDFVASSTTADLRRSDHEGFWAFGYPAIMITDTSEFRYTGYHCADGEDSPDRLNNLFATQTVAATVVAAATALRTDGPPAVSPSDAIRTCDPVTNDGCGDRDKCAMVQQDAGWYAMTCVPLAASPVASFEICTRPNGTPGEDTCDEGNFCAFWGLPLSTPQERWCLPTCGANADCGENQACLTFTDTLPDHGACSSTCDPFDADSCAENLNCASGRRDSDGNVPWTCNRFGPAVAGDYCTPGFDGCSRGLTCGYSIEDGLARCGAPCDNAHPCSGGRTCQVQTNTAEATSGVGVCH
jgi:hypothetical protein